MQGRLEPRGKVLSENRKTGTKRRWGESIVHMFYDHGTYINYLM